MNVAHCMSLSLLVCPFHLSWNELQQKYQAFTLAHRSHSSQGIDPPWDRKKAIKISAAHDLHLLTLASSKAPFACPKHPRPSQSHRISNQHCPALAKAHSSTGAPALLQLRSALPLLSWLSNPCSLTTFLSEFFARLTLTFPPQLPSLPSNASITASTSSPFSKSTKQ